MRKYTILVVIIIMLLLFACSYSNITGEKCPVGTRWHWYKYCVAATKYQDLTPYTDSGLGRTCSACAFGYKIDSCWFTCE